MRAHTITTQARVGGKGRMTRRIVPGAILALSLAVALSAATASSPGAATTLNTWDCPPPAAPDCVPHSGLGVGPSFDFGDREVGTTSRAQPLALAVNGDTFNPSIGVSGDYAQTNDCSPTMLNGQSCTINVTFAPTGTGPKTGTLSTGPGGRTLRLTGNGVTTPTPWDWPLELLRASAKGPSLTAKKVKLLATTNIDSTVVVSGGVKKTTKRVAAGEKAKIRAKIKHRTRLIKEPRKVEIRFAATDEFGQTVTEEIRVAFCAGPSSTCH
jgi:hypothetical protein